jgi:hypothetical protein
VAFGLCGGSEATSWVNTKIFILTEATKTGLAIRGGAAQTANLQEWQNNGGTLLASVDKDGAIVSGDATNACKMYVASAGAAPELDFRVGGARKAVVGHDDNVARKRSIFYNDTHAGGYYVWDVNGICMGRDQTTYANNALFIEQQNNKIYTNALMQLGVGTSTFGTNNKLLVNAYNTVNNTATAQISTSAIGNKGLVVQGFAGQTANLQEWQDNTGTALAAVAMNGAIKPASMADAAAENNTIYYSTTQSKLVYKDAGGVANALY